MRASLFGKRRTQWHKNELCSCQGLNLVCMLAFRKCRILSLKIILCFICFFSFFFRVPRSFFLSSSSLLLLLMLLLLFHFVFLLCSMDYLRMALECLLKSRVKKRENTCFCSLLEKEEKKKKMKDMLANICSSLFQCILLSPITTD